MNHSLDQMNLRQSPLTVGVILKESLSLHLSSSLDYPVFQVLYIEALIPE